MLFLTSEGWKKNIYLDIDILVYYAYIHFRFVSKAKH